jgi:DNA-binding XRE family transcriptional regulator
MASNNPVDRGAADVISPRSKTTILELSLRVEGDGESFAKKDAVERAVRELIRDGLLACDCRRIWPTEQRFASRSCSAACSEGVMDIAAHFGDNLARCRKRADLSQGELGIRASLHRTEISQLERGLRNPRIDTLVKLAGSLEIPAEDLLTRLTWSPGDCRPGRFKGVTVRS